MTNTILLVRFRVCERHHVVGEEPVREHRAVRRERLHAARIVGELDTGWDRRHGCAYARFRRRRLT